MDEKMYLCYTLAGCEMGSEGHSSYMNFQLISGKTELEVAKKYNPLRSKNITTADIQIDEYGNFTYHNYFTQYYTLLPNEISMYGHVRPMEIAFPVLMHPDDTGEEGKRYGNRYYRRPIPSHAKCE